MVPNAQRKVKGKEHRGEKCNVTKPLCRDECKNSVNDISNVRCHGLECGEGKERRITILFNVMKEH